MLCMHSGHTKLGNLKTLHRARRYTARLQVAIMLCMHTKHAKLGNANALHRARRHTARLLGAIVLYMRSEHANLAMRMHCIVPAGTLHRF